MRAASAASGQHVFVLSSDARDEARILDVRGRYRVSGGDLCVDVLEQAGGTLQATLLGYIGHQPRRVIWVSPPRAYNGPSRVRLDLTTGDVTLNDAAWGRADPSAIGPRFCWRFSRAADGSALSRITSHYRADRGGGDDHDEAYYTGDNYVDYEEESRAQREQILGLLERWRAEGPLLEVGCATGSLLKEIESARGIAGVGVDISAWAVARAAESLGHSRVWQTDLDRDPFPAAIQQAAPFRTIVMFSVLEHLEHPQAALAALSAIAARGTLLLLETTNCDSLCHRVFGDDWEGYFDRTHRAVDRVGVRTVPQWLSTLGWTIAEQRTRMIWDGSADPTHATFRDWWDSDARFRRMLDERDLGDLLFCAAVKS
jgi:2-polyprenyl-3-methyl-5-hydroxy-6-metoxy-1,4-benzoquinol methylase